MPFFGYPLNGLKLPVNILKRHSEALRLRIVAQAFFREAGDMFPNTVGVLFRSKIQTFPETAGSFGCLELFSFAFLPSFAFLLIAFFPVLFAVEVLLLLIIKAGNVILPVFFDALAPVLNIPSRPAVRMDKNCSGLLTRFVFICPETVHFSVKDYIAL